MIRFFTCCFCSASIYPSLLFSARCQSPKDLIEFVQYRLFFMLLGFDIRLNTYHFGFDPTEQLIQQFLDWNVF